MFLRPQWPPEMNNELAYLGFLRGVSPCTHHQLLFCVSILLLGLRIHPGVAGGDEQDREEGEVWESEAKLPGIGRLPIEKGSQLTRKVS